ncbi:MAG TPA: (2Fe-2S)-binding protein [Gemmatales bacterium]|nr:(2Fe-2S)-binding protein [Gemmatales bacterium]
MHLDDEVCYCFHVTRRKLLNWCRREGPRVPSQLSECGGAGTGCGWCIPFLKKIHREVTTGSVDATLAELSAARYAEERAGYIRAGKGKPAPGATPLPPADS